MREEAQILIVDDQEGIRKLLLEACSLLGYEAMAAASGQEALALMQEHHFQVALVDMRMPGLDGLGTTEQLLEIGKGLKIIVMTGYCDCESEIKEISRDLRIAAVLKKPFALEELQAFLEKNIIK